MKAKETFTGIVTNKIFFQGSKSEHKAIVLEVESEDGKAFKLQLRGGNPFREPSLERFVGHRVTVEAVRMSGALMVDDLAAISVIPPGGYPPKFRKSPKP